MTFAVKLKELRLARNLSQKQLAKLIEVSPKTYRNYELGKTTPRIATFKKIILALETTGDELLELK